MLPRHTGQLPSDATWKQREDLRKRWLKAVNVAHNLPWNASQRMPEYRFAVAYLGPQFVTNLCFDKRLAWEQGK